MKEIVLVLNKLSLCALQNMVKPPNTLRLWIQDGEITGFANEDGNEEKLYKIERRVVS